MSAHRGYVCVLLALLAGCKHLDFPLSTAAPTKLRTRSLPPATVDVRYLGSGGFLIRRGSAVVMTAPLFTNPFVPDYLLGKKLRPRHDFIRDFVRDVNLIADGTASTDFETDLRAVSLVVSGHAHYDHLMDVPAVAADYMSATRPAILTSLTGKRTLDFYHVPNLVALNEPGDNYADFTTVPPCGAVPEGCSMPANAPGRWWPSPAGTPARVRVLATSSDHPPQLAGILFWPGCHKAPLGHEPTDLEDWPVGEVLAFLIDFLDANGQVAYRIYYEDAPLPPCRQGPLKAQVLADHHPVDLALLCTGNFHEVPDAQTIVFELGAHNVILHHWDWFFDETTYRKRHFAGLPGSSADEYLALVAVQLQRLGVQHPEDHVEILEPGVRMTY